MYGALDGLRRGRGGGRHLRRERRGPDCGGGGGLSAGGGGQRERSRVRTIRGTGMAGIGAERAGERAWG